MKILNIFNKVMEIEVKKLTENARLPSKAHDTDACYDMWATSLNKTPMYIQYGTGIAMHIPKGYVGLIFPRSSITKEDLMLKNSVGVIDSGYVGEISFRFTKIANDTWKEEILTSGGLFSGGTKRVINVGISERELKTYKVGDKIGQIMFIKLPKIKFKAVDEFKETERGDGGYGSTGK